MNSFEREIKNNDGTIETLVMTSNDNYTLKLNKNYKLANHTEKKRK